MASYKPVVVQAVPKLGEKVTQDTLYWRGYKVRHGRPPGGLQRRPETRRGGSRESQGSASPGLMKLTSPSHAYCAPGGN